MIEIGEDQRLDGLTVVMTGVTSGLGQHVAIDLYKRGARLILLCLNKMEGDKVTELIKKEPNKGISHKGGDAIVIKELDLSSLESVRQCANRVLHEEHRIDILINNAGVLITEQKLSEDGYQIHYAVNYLGHCLLTLLLLPLIKKSTSARIVNTASVIHYLGRPLKNNELHAGDISPTKAYAISKFAIVMFTKVLARKLKGTGINVYCLHPGIVDTPMADKYLKSFNLIFRILITLTSYPFTRSPEQAAKAVIYCSLHDKLRTETGQYYSECKNKTAALKTDNLELQNHLWKTTLELLKINDYFLE